MNDKIELLKCPKEGIGCEDHRLVINRDYCASQNYMHDKDYSRSILALKNAFHKTTELNETSCLNCARLFRSTITESLEYIHEDLLNMSTGILGTKRFQSSFELAVNVLMEMKREI
ncbi:MAG: hypothetical protein Q8S54_04090 [Bacteroidota bacterium]|nr:hypothetical protein [Odoribacter sp.]MDP3642356.1 hypothetical protein [Bacteroidota bacterium]